MVRIIRNLLKQLGFEDVDEASDGSEALSKMRERRYGLIISDWNMQPMTGYELLKQVRADRDLHSTPFIMMTAESKTENVIAAKRAGVNNYIGGDGLRVDEGGKVCHWGTFRLRLPEFALGAARQAHGFHCSRCIGG